MIHPASEMQATEHCSPNRVRGRFERLVSRLAALLLCFALALAFANTLHGTTPEEAAVLAPIAALFDGMTKHDKGLMRQQLLPGGMVTLLRNGQAVQLHFDAFLDRLPSGTQRLEERIHDPVIHIDHDVAVIWAPYDFYIDGKIDHCGTNIFSLLNHDGRWLISGAADNGRKDCTAH